MQRYGVFYLGCNLNMYHLQAMTNSKTHMHPPPFPPASVEKLSMGQIAAQGIRKAVASAFWVYKILIPISFFTMVLHMSHFLDRLDGILGPVMGILDLPTRAAMPILIGVLTGIYGGVASMAVLGFSMREATLIAIFLLISHNMIQESAVQASSGIHPAKAAFARLFTSFGVVWLIGQFWHPSADAMAVSSVAIPSQAGFMLHLKLWGIQTFYLCLKIFGILLCIMTTVTWMKARQVTHQVVRILTPVLKVMGLRSNVGLLWLTAILFGVAYGGAVIIEETRAQPLPQEDLERLHLSIGINHAMIEDPALFLSLGIHPAWLWIPRLMAAFLAVHLLRLARMVFRQPAKTQVDLPR